MFDGLTLALLTATLAALLLWLVPLPMFPSGVYTELDRLVVLAIPAQALTEIMLAAQAYRFDIGANALPIIFGDLSGYRIVDRIGLSTMRDPFTLAAVGQVRFHARKRVGGDITHMDRFVRLRVAV